MRFLTFISLLFLMLGVLSCKKESTITIQAQDYNNPSDGSKYGGMHFQIIERRSSGFDNTKSKVVVDDYLDGNGRAVFNLDMKRSSSYVLGIEKPDGICYTEITIEYFLDYGQNNTINFNYAGCSYLKFILNNINCFDTSDKINYARIWLTTNEENGSNIYYGCDYYEGDYFSLPAGLYRYEWEVTRNGTTTNFNQDFTLTAGDSLIFQIDY